MDLRLFWAVVKRFKRIFIGGTILAVLLAVLAYGTPGPGGITPHGSVTWASKAELLITQSDGVYGRADAKTISAQNPNYMSSLSPIYTGLANGSAVQAAVKQSKVPGTVTATEGVDPNTGVYTPFITLTASGPTAADAGKLSTIGITAFQNYITQMEVANGVPATSRITLAVIRNGLPPEIASKPKPTIPVLVFLAIMSGTILLLFSLENHDPQSAAAIGRVAPSAKNVGALPLADNGGHAVDAHRGHGMDRLHRVGDKRSTTLESLIKGR
jgi:hypothetical protein